MSKMSYSCQAETRKKCHKPPNAGGDTRRRVERSPAAQTPCSPSNLARSLHTTILIPYTSPSHSLTTNLTIQE